MKYKFRAYDESNEVMEYGVGVDKGRPVKEGYQLYNTENTVYHSQLMQFTGLTDRIGREIYEHSELDGAYEVIFKDLRYSLRHIHNNDIIDLYDYWRDKNGEIEVTREYTKV